jgi:acyl-CoA thioesterase-1
MYVRRLRIVSRLLLFLLLALPFAARAEKHPRPLLVCFGDSITAGYGLQSGQSYPDALGDLLSLHGYSYQVINKGTSGATSKDALATLPVVVSLHPEIVIVEFGGNDGLRGLPLQLTRRNFEQILSQLEAAHIKVLLAGITLPVNYGSDYIHQFEQMYRDLAAEHHTLFVPMLYKDLVHVPGSLQEDGIHPTAKGSRIIAETLYKALGPGLKKQGLRD